MLSRSSISRNAPRALAAGRRAMASAANPTFQYDVSEASGVKVANREVGGATGTLALVAKAGSRYQPFPGFSDALEKFAFKVGFSRSPAVIHWPSPFNSFFILTYLFVSIDYTQALCSADHS
jgi:ubiquinol-cytochrome c reductase core subunit 2